MNDGPDRKSHTITWIVSALALLLFYLATWPPIELKMTWYKNIPSIDPDTAPDFQRVRPQWVDILYQPLHYLASLNQGANVVAMYYDCWAKPAR